MDPIKKAAYSKLLSIARKEYLASFSMMIGVYMKIKFDEMKNLLEEKIIQRI